MPRKAVPWGVAPKVNGAAVIGAVVAPKVCTEGVDPKRLLAGPTMVLGGADVEPKGPAGAPPNMSEPWEATGALLVLKPSVGATEVALLP